MKPSVILGAVALSLLFACSANSGDAESTSGPASGAGSSTGATSNTGSGAGPNLGVAGSLSLGEMGGSAGGPLVENGECAQQNFVLASKPADVLLVLDRSKSMIEHKVPPGVWRWDAVVPAVTAVIAATDSAVSWGLKVFPEGEGAACVATGVTAAIPVPIAPANAATVNAMIKGTMAAGNGTPTGDAINQATAYLKSRNVGNQYIVLATDGEPSCPSGSDAALSFAVAAITAAKTAGFPTYVIGVIDPVEDSSTVPRLNAMADAGGTSRSDNPIGDKFYHAFGEAELTASLQAVTGQVASCVFEFEKPPPDATNIAVKVNGAQVMQDTTKAQGWDYTSDQYLSLELHGDACQQVKDATENKVDIIFGCKGVPIKVF